MEIVRDEADRWRFARILYLLNDSHQTKHRREHQSSPSPERHKSDLCLDSRLFIRPDHWPERDPLVAILAWTLMPNHFHLLLQEIREGGISKFMQRLCGSMSAAFNEKYDEKGSIFQGAYKSRTIDSDPYFHHIVPYIAVKNVFELYPGGLREALRDYDTAWQWAKEYPFTSFQTHAFKSASPIIDMAHLRSLGVTEGSTFKTASWDMLMTHMNSKEIREEHSNIFLEDW